MTDDDLRAMEKDNARLRKEVAEWKENHSIVTGCYNLACEDNERLRIELKEIRNE